MADKGDGDGDDMDGGGRGPRFSLLCRLPPHANANKIGPGRHRGELARGDRGVGGRLVSKNVTMERPGTGEAFVALGARGVVGTATAPLHLQEGKMKMTPGGPCRVRVVTGMKTLAEAKEQRDRISKVVTKALVDAYCDPQHAKGWYVRVVVDRQVIARLVSKEETDQFLEGYVSTR